MPPSSGDFGTLTACRFAYSYRRARFGRASAAVLGEVVEQLVHGVVARCVDHRATLPAHRDQLGIPQAVEMEAQGVRRQTQCRRDLPGWHPFRSCLHKEPVGVQTVLLAESIPVGLLASIDQLFNDLTIDLNLGVSEANEIGVSQR